MNFHLNFFLILLMNHHYHLLMATQYIKEQIYQWYLFLNYFVILFFLIHLMMIIM